MIFQSGLMNKTSWSKRSRKYEPTKPQIFWALLSTLRRIGSIQTGLIHSLFDAFRHNSRPLDCLIFQYILDITFEMCAIVTSEISPFLANMVFMPKYIQRTPVLRESLQLASTCLPLHVLIQRKEEETSQRTVLAAGYNHTQVTSGPKLPLSMLLFCSYKQFALFTHCALNCSIMDDIIQLWYYVAVYREHIAEHQNWSKIRWMYLRRNMWFSWCDFSNICLNFNSNCILLTKKMKLNLKAYTITIHFAAKSEMWFIHKQSHDSFWLEQLVN